MHFVFTRIRISPLLSYFEKNSSYVCIVIGFERSYLCGFAALCVRMFDAGANKIEGTMS